MDVSRLPALLAVIQGFEGQDFEDRQSQILLRSVLKEVDMSAVGVEAGDGNDAEIETPFENIKGVLTFNQEDGVCFVKLSSMVGVTAKLSQGDFNFATADASGIELGVGKFTITAAVNVNAKKIAYFAFGQ